MRIFKTKVFSSFARHERISDAALCDAIARAESGLIAARLGGGVIKQRIARPNQGKSGGFRSIIFFRVGERAIFAVGFAKNQKDNISENNLKALKLLAQTLLSHSDDQIQDLVDKEELTEVFCDEEEDV